MFLSPSVSYPVLCSCLMLLTCSFIVLFHHYSFLFCFCCCCVGNIVRSFSFLSVIIVFLLLIFPSLLCCSSQACTGCFILKNNLMHYGLLLSDFLSRSPALPQFDPAAVQFCLPVESQEFSRSSAQVSVCCHQLVSERERAVDRGAL